MHKTRYECTIAPPANDGLRRNAARVLRDVATAPAVPLSLGNFCLAADTAEPWGIAANGGTFLATAGLRAYESISGRRLGLPFWLLAAINTGSAVSVAYNGAETVGFKALCTFQGEAMKYVSSALAFSGWAVGHGCAARRSMHPDSQPVRRLLDPQIYYGVGDLAAVQGNPVSSAVFAIGLARALLGRAAVDDGTGATGLGSFLRKHATPARFYGCGYVLGSLLSLQNPLFAAAQGAWGVGYFCFERGSEGRFLRDLKTILALGFSAVASMFVGRRPSDELSVEPSAGYTTRDLGALWAETNSLRSALGVRLGLGLHLPKPTGELERAVGALTGAYSGLSDEDKDKAYRLLELLAFSSSTASRALAQLHDQGDPRGLHLTEPLRLER